MFLRGDDLHFKGFKESDIVLVYILMYFTHKNYF